MPYLQLGPRLTRTYPNGSARSICLIELKQKSTLRYGTKKVLLTL
jgi:hypothetical protein